MEMNKIKNDKLPLEISLLVGIFFVNIYIATAVWILSNIKNYSLRNKYL